MLMYAIIGAIVCGIVMAVAHSKTKQGVAWGQPLEIAAGLAAIVFACWAIYENVAGKPEAQVIAEKWQEVRGIGAAEWVKKNCDGKKLLVIKNYSVAGQTDRQFEAFKKGIDGMTVEVFELPQPKEMAEGEMPEMMYMDGMQVTPAMKKEMKKKADEMDADIASKVSADKYDTVVFLASLPDFMIYPKPLGTIKALQKKNYVFLYGIDEMKGRFIAKQIVGILADKALSNPDDYDKAPTGDQTTDFNFRYEFKAGAAK